ncbi:MAG: hypothetical protein ABSF63_08165 [Candidatus Bathyarchaeia archaeon]|jgi:hypothetical protein
MTKPAEKALDIALEVTGQLLSLATATIAASIAFLGLSGIRFGSWTIWVGIGILLELASAAAGLFVYGIAASKVKKRKTVDVSYEPGVRFAAALQWVLFLLGLGLVAYGFFTGLLLDGHVVRSANSTLSLQPFAGFCFLLV